MAHRRRSWLAVLIVLGLCLVARSAAAQRSSAPQATTGVATNVTATSATLTGTVSANGPATTAYFQWGTTTAYGMTTASQSVGNWMGTVSVSAPLTGLTPSRTYHYRVVASNSAGTTLGADMMLRAFSATGLTQISEDAYTNPTSQHATQVEPHVFASGDTLVAA